MTNKRPVKAQHQTKSGPNQADQYAQATKPVITQSKQLREPTISTSWLETRLGEVAPTVLAVTYWFDPPPQTNVSFYTIEITGKRIDLTDRPQPADGFVHLESVDGVVDGSGPIAVMAKIHGVNPGKWDLSARMIPAHEATPKQHGPATKTRQVALPVFRTTWSWKKWKVSGAPPSPVDTCPAPFARPPAVILGSWAALVAIGIVSALLVQMWVVESLNLNMASVLIASFVGLLSGAIGAKVWFIVLHLNKRLRDGWCIQGMVAGIIVSLPVMLTISRQPVATVLDASTPGIMLGLAIGKLGCFFTGCCAGRPTGSLFGVWCSDRRVGMRRIPVQLMESTVALLVGAIVLSVIHVKHIQHGALFIAALSGYTLVRQGLLRLRQERRKSSFGGPLTAVIAALVLTVALIFLTIGRL